MVHFNHVTKLYDNKIVAVNDITFQIEDGEFVFLIGPSGSGKTTVIKMLIRDEVPSYGKVYFKDKDITSISRSKVYKLRREIGVIFQDYKLIPDKTAYENVSFAMEAAGKSNDEIKQTVPYVLDIVGLSHRMQAFPRQLSGGEQQRVAIARAIANNPKILIADEPTGNLDPASAWDIVQILSKINNWGTTVIMSTHGTDIVNSLNKRVIQMHGGNVIRDDNKGQYEMTSGFEEQMVEKADKEKQESKDKKKKTFQVNLPKSNDGSIKNAIEGNSKLKIADVENIRVDDIPEEHQSFLGKVFSRFSVKKHDEGEALIYEEETLPNKVEKEEKKEEFENKVEEKVETPREGKIEEDVLEEQNEEPITEVLKDTPMKRPLNVNHEDEKKETVEEKIEDIKEEIKEDSKKAVKKSKLNLNLATDRSKKEEPAPVIEEPVEEKASLRKVPIRKLNLPKVVMEDLKSAGYRYIDEIIDDGPEGLSKKITIDPEEVIIIANEIKRYTEENS